MSINLLDNETINQIAAGEVIERPSSVVKELCENAVDAGASAVTIEIRDGGASLIRVTDNGCGIPKEEVRKAFLRHATSKIRTAEDLSGVMTLGFRGEALSSISAVARTEIITKTAASLTGTRFVIEGGEERVFEEVGAPEGTTIIARDLFFNTPVRKKFLKSAATEAAHVSELAEQLCLANPQVSFCFIVNGQNRFHTSGNGSLKDIIYQLYGRDTANSLIEVNAENEFFRMSGFIGRPEVSRGSRSMEHYCVNGRYIKSNVIAKGIEEGFGNLMMQHSFPFAVLLLTLSPARVDVNVHPTKKEVRFSDPQAVFEFVRGAVHEALSRTELIRTVRLCGDSRKKEAPKGRTPRYAEPFETRTGGADVPAGTGTRRPEADAVQAESGTRGTEPSPGMAAGTERTDVSGTGTQRTEASAGMAETDAPRSVTAYPADAGTPASVRETAPAAEPVIGRDGQYALFAEGHRERVRLVGDVFDTYWICEFEGSMYIIDQHAAHEKVNYERFMKAYETREVTSQQLLPPAVITLTDQEAALLETHMQDFTDLGYEISHFGGHAYVVRAVPDILPSVMKDELLKNMIGSLSEETGGRVPDLIIEKTASLSCKAAVKGNQHLTAGEAEKLLDEMFSLKDPYNCPHGRPTVIRLTRSELDRRFRRLV